MGDHCTSPHISVQTEAVTKALRFTLKQRQALSSFKVVFLVDRFWYQVLYFAVRDESSLVKRATQLLSSV